MLELHGYKYSVYTWIARLAMREKCVDHLWREVNPFADDVPPDYLALNQFCRVPTLVHDGFVVYETCAITRYIDEAFEGPALQPDGARDRARMSQIQSIIDAHGYWPLVRQVFAHDVMAERVDRAFEETEIKAGLDAAPRVLAALEAIAAGGDFLVGDRLSLADIHVAPMIGYFCLSKRGRSVFEQHAKLGDWWKAMAGRASVKETWPDLPAAPECGPGLAFNEAAVRTALAGAWSKKTARQWTRANPAAGQCNVTAVVLQDLFGGDILSTRLGRGRGRHFYNRIGGKPVDCTDGQFEQAVAYDDTPATRRQAMSGVRKSEYKELRSALTKRLTSGVC